MQNTTKSVAIIGGTHGNEFTGPHLLQRWQQNPAEITRPSFSTHLYLGNPKAFYENRRFVDDDLNRCFAKSTLQLTDSGSYEVSRAMFLNNLIGPKDHSQNDFIIDLHTSTSNCGVMIILLKDDAFSLRLAAYLLKQIPQAHIHYIPVGDGDQFLGSIARQSLGVEIGPVPQGALRYDIFELSRKVVMSALDFVHNRNCGSQMELPQELEVFKFQKKVNFPGDGPYIDAMIHESLQDHDYEALNPKDPMFRRIDGTVITYEGTDTVYPVFINEAAYYYQKVAMSLTTKEMLSVPATEI